jgi:hypothetical protein
MNDLFLYTKLLVDRRLEEYLELVHFHQQSSDAGDRLSRDLVGQPLEPLNHLALVQAVTEPLSEGIEGASLGPKLDDGRCLDPALPAARAIDSVDGGKRMGLCQSAGAHGSLHVSWSRDPRSSGAGGVGSAPCRFQCQESYSKM